MNKKILNSILLLSMMSASSACSSNENINETIYSNEEKVNEVVNYNETVNSEETVQVMNDWKDKALENEEKYIADPQKRVTVNLNVTFPETTNDVYVIGDFNNWGAFNVLNDSSYKVNNGSISISNVENGESYSYIYVQKIEGALYTYNFSSSKVDTNNNTVIGYTEDGKLISQFCITQSEDSFTFVASNNASFTNVVNSWRAPIYGETIKVPNPDLVDGLPSVGYSLCVSDYENPEEVYYIGLDALSSTDGQGRRQFVAYGVTLKYQTAFTIYDANSYTNWAETNLEQYGAGRNFVTSSKIGVVCLEEGTYDIYVKLAYENNSIYIQKTGESSGDEGGSGQKEAPTSGYALYVTPSSGKDSYYVILAQHEPFGDYQQYFGDNVKFAAGDKFSIYDGTNKAYWSNIKIDPASLTCFSSTADGIECSASGEYDIYIKMKYQDDQIYIGPAF